MFTFSKVYFLLQESGKNRGEDEYFLVVINRPNWQKLLDSPKIDGILILNLILLYWLFMR